MQPVQCDGTTVDRCPTCGGMFFDLEEEPHVLRNKELVAKIDTHPRSHDADAKVRIECPRDGEPMVHVHDVKQHHVGYETCPACGGVYLDAGELKDLSEFSFGEWLRRMFS
jgi:Zn-finger nucleic acid-binding protein